VLGSRLKKGRFGKKKNSPSPASTSNLTGGAQENVAEAVIRRPKTLKGHVRAVSDLIGKLKATGRLEYLCHIYSILNEGGEARPKALK